MPEQERMEIQLGDIEGMNFVAQTPSGQKIVMDADPEFGGRGLGPEPIHLLMAGLGGCTGMDVVSILGKMRVQPDDFRIIAEAEAAEEHPRVFTSIHLTYQFTGRDLPGDKLRKAVDLSQERYCSVSAMLRRACDLTYELSIKEQ